MYTLYEQYIYKLSPQGRYRTLPPPRQESHNKQIDFSTNDYLGLSKNAAVIKAGIEAATLYGAGATGSRLLSGNSTLHESFEHNIAKDKNTEAALILSSGFQTNLSVLSALLAQDALYSQPIVFFDKYNHSSLYQAVFLAKSQLIRYKHNDMNHLAELLLAHQHDDRPKFIVTETMFGMEGDILPIRDVIYLAQKHNAFLYLDEAHATGILGEFGYGLSTSVDLHNVQHLVMGTLSKALGCSGGYVASTALIKNYLINKTTGFIYSTAPSPFTVGSSHKAWQLVNNMHEERANIIQLANSLREQLTALGFNLGNSQLHIITVVFKTLDEAIKVYNTLLCNNVITSLIRPPTTHSIRIRAAITSQHTQEHIQQFINIMEQICKST